MIKLPVPMNLAQIAGFIGGELHGPADLMIDTVATSPLLAPESSLALVFDKAMLKDIDKCKAKAVVVPKGVKVDRPAIFVARPSYAIYKMLSTAPAKRYFPEKGIHPTAVVDSSCIIGEDVAIGPLVVVGPKTKIGTRTKIMSHTVIGGEVSIGEDCLLHPGCLVADNVQIGNRVILQQGASIGPDGFGYITERLSNMELRMKGINELSEEDNPLLKIPQIGTVILEDDVEIGSNTTIDRATIGATKIGKGTKVDNLVMIAHNCQIGKEVILVSQVGIAGSCVVGDRAVMAGQVGVADHVKIGKDAILQGQSGVMKNVDDTDVQMGSPSFAVKDYMSSTAVFRKLPSLLARNKVNEKKIAKLEALLEELKANASHNLDALKK